VLPMVARGGSEVAPGGSESHRGGRRVGEKQTRFARKRVEVSWKFPCQGNKHRLTGKSLRRCLFLLFGSTESEAVFVSFV